MHMVLLPHMPLVVTTRGPVGVGPLEVLVLVVVVVDDVGGVVMGGRLVVVVLLVVEVLVVGGRAVVEVVAGTLGHPHTP